MRETKHTPGPWIIVGNKIQTESTDRERKTICTVNAPAFEPDTPDAILIASAPALLARVAELRAALESIEADADYGKDNPRRQTDKLFDILETARAALAHSGTPEGAAPARKE